MSPFENSSYLSQVRRLRQLAEAALVQFGVQPGRIDFLHHGENATFKITDRKGREYLLRIHRQDYHTLAGIEEELKWLEFLADRLDLDTPKPLRTRDGRRVLVIGTPAIPSPRPVTMLKWMEGRILYDAVRPKHLEELGRVIGQIQKATRGRRVSHRLYWNPESMLGRKPKWGQFDDLPGVKPAVQRKITEARIHHLKELKSFERRHPDRMGLIHSDMHFGNLLRTKHGWGVIDFDDCGYGFQAYDLNAPLMSVHYVLLDKRRMKEFHSYRDALIEGYMNFMSWDADDDRLLDQLMAARSMIVLGWLNSRSDNPRLKARLKGAVKRTLKILDASE